ncbi:MAG TPA: UbiD family decarboxylase [Candidatus Limnocylindria bacterium]|nr:UbiD family decarboxylase [Candidatus Limnocylindria bacterium]
MADLRTWLDEVNKLGQLMTVNDAHWNLELSALTELINERSKTRPAIVFDKIKEYPAGHRVAVNLLSSLQRLALTLGMDPNLAPFDFVQQWRKRVKSIQAVEPRLVKSAPLFENVQKGADIDLFKFPVPKWHELDGGRYIGTDDLVITRDPEEGWVNVGTYRIMIHGRDHMGLHMSPGKHGRVHRDKSHAEGKALPIAVSFGHHPINFLVASTDVPYRVNEYAYAGGITGRPHDIVAGPLTGLPIPADSEIAIEGEVVPNDLMAEGPFGEWTGYYASNQPAVPVIRVKAIYHRNDPILCGFPLLKPSSGDNLHFSLMLSALIWNALDEAGVPDVQAVWSHPSGGRFMTVLAIKQRYPGHARQAAMIASQCRSGAYLGRYVIVVDEDIDITNTEEVIWAISSRSDPVDSIEILRRCWSGPLDPRIPVGEKGFNSRAIIDATRPYEWRDKFPKSSGHSRELKDKVAGDWQGFLNDKVGVR